MKAIQGGPSIADASGSPALPAAFDGTISHPKPAAIDSLGRSKRKRKKQQQQSQQQQQQQHQQPGDEAGFVEDGVVTFSDGAMPIRSNRLKKHRQRPL